MAKKSSKLKNTYIHKILKVSPTVWRASSAEITIIIYILYYIRVHSIRPKGGFLKIFKIFFEKHCIDIFEKISKIAKSDWAYIRLGIYNIFGKFRKFWAYITLYMPIPLCSPACTLALAVALRLPGYCY